MAVRSFERPTARAALLAALGAASCAAQRAEPSPVERAPPQSSAREFAEHVAPRLQAREDREAGLVQGARAKLDLGDEIVVAGRRVHIGAPVVLWSDPGGYDAYQERGVFGAASVPDGKRYRPGRATSGVRDASARDPIGRDSGGRDSGGRDSGDAREPLGSAAATLELVDQFVLHYDACGLSRTCFKVLQDRRGLSVHFLLDLDGTLYQTLDLADTAWHAKQANARSVGVEIANIGAYPVGETEPLDRWYVADERGTKLRVPSEVDSSGLRSGSRELRPARPNRVRGEVQGREFEMYDFTPEQYASLVKLAAALSAIFPKLPPVLARDASGAVRTTSLDGVEFESFSGILGHCHVSAEKEDPGPAFDWERFSARVHMLLALVPHLDLD